MNASDDKKESKKASEESEKQNEKKNGHSLVAESILPPKKSIKIVFRKLIC